MKETSPFFNTSFRGKPLTYRSTLLTSPNIQIKMARTWGIRSTSPALTQRPTSASTVSLLSHKDPASQFPTAPYPHRLKHAHTPTRTHMHVHTCTHGAGLWLPHLQLLLPLQCKLLEGLHNEASIGAVVDEDGWATHPRLQVIYGQRDVLRVVLENKHRSHGYADISRAPAAD